MKIEITKSEAEEMDFRHRLISDKTSELNILKSEVGFFANNLLKKYGKTDGEWSYMSGAFIPMKEPESKDGVTATNS